MAITALDTTKTRDWVFSGDTDDPTVFEIATLTSRDVARIRDSVTTFDVKTGKPGSEDEEGTTTRTTVEKAKLTFEACRRGLKGWRNFKGANGQPIKYEDVQREIDRQQRRVIKDELLDMIPLEVLEEMADAIMSGSEPQEGEVGNSQGQSSEE